jgi:hypothetical protein
MLKRDQEHYEIARSSVSADRLRDLSSTAFTARNIPIDYRRRSQAIIASISTQSWPKAALNSCAGSGAGGTSSQVNCVMGQRNCLPVTPSVPLSEFDS